MKLYRALLTAGALLVATGALAHPSITRELLQTFWLAAQSATTKVISLTTEKKRAIEQALGQTLPKELGEADTFIVVGKSGSLGVLMNFDPPGISMGLAIDRDRKKIVKARIYNHSGTHKMDAPAFLNQFVGKTAADPFKVGKDIKSVKGAEKESQAVATDVKAALLLARNGW